MEKFDDSEGRTWPLSITIRKVKEIRDEIGVDLLDFSVDEENKESIPKLLESLADPVTLGDTLWILCRGKAETDGVSDEKFGESLVGDVIENAADALLTEIANFFPKSRGVHLHKMFTMMKRVEAKLLEGVSEKLADPQLEESMNRAVAGILSTDASE